jgi:hypothetical protein
MRRILRAYWKKHHPSKRIWIKKAARGVEIPSTALEEHPALKKRLLKMGLEYHCYIDAMVLVK